MNIEEFIRIDITKPIIKPDDVEKTYPKIVSEVMEYIIEKKKDSSVAMIDLIHDYCIQSGNSIEHVGDAIQNDVYFKSFIESDCINHNIIRSDKKKIGEW